MTKKEKIKTLVEKVREQMPDATELDFRKATPTGRVIAKVIDEVSRSMYSKTQDKEWVRAGKEIVRTITGSTTKPAKPSADYETK